MPGNESAEGRTPLAAQARLSLERTRILEDYTAPGSGVDRTLFFSLTLGGQGSAGTFEVDNCRPSGKRAGFPFARGFLKLGVVVVSHFLALVPLRPDESDTIFLFWG